MVDIPGWDEWIVKNPDRFKRVLGFRSKYDQIYEFPAPLDQDECRESTIDFACSRLGINYERYSELKQKELADNPKFEIYCKEYPLPIGSFAIVSTYMRKRWYWTELHGFYGHRLIVGNERAIIGLAKKYQNGNTVGWFLGLVKTYDRYMNTETELGEIEQDEALYVYFYPPFEFIEGMVLFEGKLDESVIRQLKDYEKFYNKNILGKIVTGRPRSDPEYWLEPARAKIQEKPDITQDDLAHEIGCDLKTFKINRKNGGFATYKEFKDSVLKP
ncbi:MAG: hypothetical protein PHT43_04555 [Anaerolineaceae bacterium]|jgi:hypothetical protein|nr:hypothetical protein [Anaerolineaceae bacterium]